MNDLTVIFLTVNKVPDSWAEYHRLVLLDAIGATPTIIISKKPMDWTNDNFNSINLIQEEEPSVTNIYKQLLRGAKVATTPYIAVVEDDTLYHRSHFDFRPPSDTFGYDGHRWGIFTWGKPFYYHKDRISNAAMIAPRKLVIDSLEERLSKYPNSNLGELGKEKGTTIDRKKTVIFWPEIGMVYFSHKNSLDPTEQHKSKRPGVVQAFDIPYWGRAEDLRKNFI